MAGALHMLRIEIDGHFHGSKDVPRPWVAKITGISAKFGLAREFVDPMNDWRDASKAWSGNTYGVVATFPLRDGNIYECSRTRGNPSKRHVVREFYAIEGGKRLKIEPEDALGRTIDITDAVVFDVAEDPDSPPWVAEVTRVGSTAKQGFVLIDRERRYLLRRKAMYEVKDSNGLRLIVTDQSARVSTLTQLEALEWLRSKAEI
jgi:hypothetical protein